MRHLILCLRMSQMEHRYRTSLHFQVLIYSYLSCLLHFLGVSEHIQEHIKSVPFITSVIYTISISF